MTLSPFGPAPIDPATCTTATVGSAVGPLAQVAPAAGAPASGEAPTGALVNGATSRAPAGGAPAGFGPSNSEHARFEPGRVDVATIGVVVPARNEELRLPRCLAALRKAVHALRAGDSTAPRVRIVVVVDDSTDGTHGVASGWAGVEVVQSRSGRVGAARAMGVRHVLRSEMRAGASAERVWIACTDADSAVPGDWLHTQLLHARAGFELVLGTVRPDPRELAGGVLAAWRLRHLVTDGHPHVHGANMGIRGDTYNVVGGFQAVAAHEDLFLSNAVDAAGRPVASTAASPVLTSGRLRGRAPSGMADYLRHLAAAEVDLPA